MRFGAYSRLQQIMMYVHTATSTDEYMNYTMYMYVYIQYTSDSSSVFFFVLCWEMLRISMVIVSSARSGATQMASILFAMARGVQLCTTMVHV